MCLVRSPKRELMIKPTNLTERADLVKLGADLASVHDTDDLTYALRVRLHADGLGFFANCIMQAGLHEAEGSAVHPGLIAPALLARLRIDGRGDLADAISALLSPAFVDCDPRFQISEGDEWIVERDELIARLRADGWGERATSVATGELSGLRNNLVARLRLDGHGELADAIDEASWAFERHARGEQARPKQPPVTTDKHEASAKDKTAPPPEEVLGRAHRANVLACAALMRLRAEGRDILAGSIMAQWLDAVVGPIADPARLATALLPRLRAEDRGEIADTIEPLLRDAPIARDPGELLRIWLSEVEGPLIDAGPLAAVLVARLRWEKHEGLPGGEKRGALADTLVELLRYAGFSERLFEEHRETPRPV